MRHLLLLMVGLLLSVGNINAQHSDAGNEAKRQYSMGWNYLNGENGYEKNLTKAFNCFQNAANGGYVPAYSQTGYMLEEGEGTQKDMSAAFSWYQKSAKADNAYGQYRLALCYQYGTGTAKDYQQALNWYKKSANQDFIGAYINMGYLLEYGQGVQNPEEAFKCYKKAAEKGDKDGQYYLAMCYINATGTECDDAQARQWLQKSAAQGNQYAKARLADMDKPAFNQPPTVSFIGFSPETSQANYSLDIGVNASNGRITKTVVYLNGSKVPETRGINPVREDGFDMRWKKTLTLKEGQNTIRVEATNRAGTGVKESIVNYNMPLPEIKEKRIALVIGNSNYIDQDKSLRNPSNDASDMSAKLKGLGFEVMLQTDANHKSMDDIIFEFGEKARDYDVALFFYAGHGIQNKGMNYLIPTDAVLRSEDEVKYQCVNASMVLDKLEKSRCWAKIVILDACRNNPFARSWHRGETTRGLANMDTSGGIFIGYATSPGDVARDGEGRNSPFTQALLKALDEYANQPLEMFYKKVIKEVKQITKNQQNPWNAGSFDGDFYFKKK